MMTWLPRSILFTAAIGLSACSLMSLQRDPRSGYAQNPYAEPQDASRALIEEEISRDELGLSGSRQMTPDEARDVALRVQLKRLEGQLADKRTRQQYYNYKPYMPTDSARIQFLQLPSLEARDRWAQTNGYYDNPELYSAEIRALIEKTDITVGMTKQAVIQSWGDPDITETAGDPIYGNERWKYTRMVSSEDGYYKEQRIIYFEAGQVAGWERQ